MEYCGLIKLTKNVSGKEKRQWSLTILGFIGCLLKNEDEIEFIPEKHSQLIPLLFGKWTFYKQIDMINMIKKNLETGIKDIKKEFEPIIDNALNITLHEVSNGRNIREKMSRMESSIMANMVESASKDISKYLTQEILNHSFGLSHLSRFSDNGDTYLILNKLMEDEDLNIYINNYLKETHKYYLESYTNIKRWCEKLNIC